MQRPFRTSILPLAAVLGLAACTTPSKRELLESVAKDWCLTIRASQVLPVYPLTEDLQPGDVFVVQTPLSQQQEEYEAKGFLPLDQLVARLPVESSAAPADPKAGSRLPYEKFYRESYFRQAYAQPAARPLKKDDPVHMPRAAFPSYNFSYEQGSGLQLAIPIQGVPVGLGLMGASRATGAVTIDDAYTYGIDIQSLYGSLLAWWRSDEEIRKTLTRVASMTSGEIYLRAVNRVYLTRGVTVSLMSLDSFSAGVDAGAAQKLSLPDLSKTDPAEMKSSATAYREALELLAGPLNAAAPGGSFRFTQASQRAVTIDEAFDRPLVIGYLGFDVRIERNGTLSPPIPSFSVLNGSVDEFPSLEELESLIRRIDALGDQGAAIFKRAAELLGGTFRQSFEAAIDRGPRLAFMKAKNDYTNVEDSSVADSRILAINQTLKQALDRK